MCPSLREQPIFGKIDLRLAVGKVILIGPQPIATDREAGNGCRNAFSRLLVWQHGRMANEIEDDMAECASRLKAWGPIVIDQSVGRLLDDYWAPGLQAAGTFCHVIFDLIGHPTVLPDEQTAERISTAIAGFAISCDWLGSNQDHFPYCEPQVDLAEYWLLAQRRAHEAVKVAGLISASPSESVSLATLLEIPDPT